MTAGPAGPHAGPGAVAREAWSDLGQDAGHLALLRPTPAALPSRLAVGTLALDSVGVVSVAAELVLADRRQTTPRPVPVDGTRVTGSFASDRLLRIEGEAVSAFAPLSGFWPAADGWVRTHANHPHHAQRLLSLLGLATDAGPPELAVALARRPAHDLAEDAAGRGALVVAVRTPEEWAAHGQLLAVADSPLVQRTALGAAAPRPWSPDATRPLSGIRVLDLTRVVAGPVAGRDLAVLGAQVLRVDPPVPAEIGWQHLDTGQDKHSALLNLRRDPDVLETLLDSTDVVLTGYRPGALDRFGLAPGDVAARHPGIVVGTVSAWGTTGPWADRRGFDSLVQAASGIATTESRDGRTPGALPAQALDHASGHLLAAGIVCALRARAASGGSHHVAVALARTGLALQRLGTTQDDGGGPDRLDVAGLPTVTVGSLTCAVPALVVDGSPATYRRVGTPWGSDLPQWW